MNKPLLLQSSLIFEGADLIDCIRQTCIGLKNSPKKEEIKIFLKESIKYLNEDLPFNVVNELFSAILLCFSTNPNKFSSVSSHFLKRAKLNSNYLIITSFILSDLIHIQPQPPLPDYHSFVDEAINEILPQIKEDEDKNLIIFGHEISPYYKNNLIVSLLLSCTITETLFLSFFPYLFSHNLFSNNPKFNLLLQVISKNRVIHISTQTETSNKDICDFIQKDGNHLISSLSVEAISLIESVVLFIKCQDKKKIKGLKKETILQFFAVLIIIIKNYKIKEKVTFSASGLLSLLVEGTKNLSNSKSIVLFESINVILSNYFYVNGTFSVPVETLFEIFNIILNQIKRNIFIGNKMIFFHIIFDLSDKIKYYNFRDHVINFFKTNDKLIIELILDNIKEINEDQFFKTQKLNLKYFEQKFLFPNFAINENTIDKIYFLENSCIEISTKEIEKLSEQFNNYLNNKINEFKWDEVTLISKFLINQGFEKSLKNAEMNKKIPLSIKEEIFGYVPNRLANLELLIDGVLHDPHPEQNDEAFKILFDEIMCQKELLHSHFSFLFSKYDSTGTYHVSYFLTLFRNEYSDYESDMIDVCTRIFDYQPNKQLLYYKQDFIVQYIPKSFFGKQIVSQIFQKIENKSGHFQDFYFLMSIANSFPILFIDNPEKTFEIVFSTFDYISFIFDKKEDEEHLPYIKTAYCAFLFLLAILHCAIVVDHFFDWLFNNILSFSEYQILLSFIALNILNQDIKVLNISQIYVTKYNFLDKISQLVQKDVHEGYFMSCYKDNIYKYITETYKSYSESNMYIILQNDELRKKKYPLSFAYDCIFSQYPSFNQNTFSIDVNSPELNKFIKTISNQKEYWLSFDFQENRTTEPSFEEVLLFIESFPKKTLSLSDVPKLKKPLTVQMVRYLTIQKYWIYNAILYNGSVPLTCDMYNVFSEVINQLNKYRKHADNHPKEEDQADIDSLSVTDFYLKQYSQQTLIKCLIKDIFLPSLNNKCLSSLHELFVAYASNNVALLSLLSIAFECFSEIYNQCIGYASPHSLKIFYDLTDMLTKLVTVKGFKENFIHTCGNDLINIVLSPELRSDPILLWKVSNILQEIDNLPIRMTQLIGFMLTLGNENVIKAAISLCSKFTYDQLKYINQLILDIFDNEIKNKKRQSIIIIFIKYSPTINENRKQVMYSILKGLFKKLAVQKNEKIIDLMSSILNKLAPKRTDFSLIETTNEKVTQVPHYIKVNLPVFWEMFEKNMEPILSIVNDDSIYLNKFKFLNDYPELVSFKTRSSHFRKEMKKLLNMNDEFVLHIDPKDILTSSYNNFIGEPKEEILKQLYVIFGDKSQTIDFGGPTREWFTKLAKEIFNGKYGLFDCTTNMNYQPSSSSSVQDDYLQHFRFAGIFIARALIQGQCIDAHLAPTFIKQILHQKLNLKDLKEVDEQHFNSLSWILENDVDSLEMFFEIDIEEFGVHRTIPLKENGSKIKVTNENKEEFVELNSQFVLSKKIEDQVKAFCDGFDLLIPNEKIKYFSPKEFDLLICGVTEFDVDDLIENIEYEYPYTADSPVIQMFIKEIKTWNNDLLSKLLFFMTGSSRIPANGFKEFTEITGFPLKIAAGGDENCLPQAHTCFNTIDLPSYSNEADLKNKLLYAIQECNSFELI